MKLIDRKVKTVLAGEYVLGLLQGKVLARFEKMVASEKSLQQEVHFWEQYFYGLTEALPPVQPPARVWEKISKRVGIAEKVPKDKLTFGLEFWNGFISAGVLSLLIGFFLFVTRVDQSDLLSSKNYVAILEDKQSQPILVARINTQQDALILEMLKPAIYDDGKDLQVWCLPKTNEPPISMGIVKRKGITRFELSHEEMIMLKDARALAVSIEPRGGSEQPTGPILYSGLSI